MKIGIFGGTFDPIHNGHLIIAETVRSDYPLDRILFIPSAQPPHKKENPVSPFETRLNMVARAIEGVDLFECSDIEQRRGGLSYSIQTVQNLIEEHPVDDFYFIIGGDSLVELHTWYQPDQLLSSLPVIVANRPGFDLSGVRPDWLRQVHIIKTPLIEISSTNLRERVRQGHSIRFQVPENVIACIEQEGLYR